MANKEIMGLPEIGGSSTVEEFVEKVFAPTMAGLSQALRQLSAKVELIDKANKTIVVEVKFPDTINITLNHREVI